MPYDENLAARIRQALASQRDVVEKRMFGGLTFMVDGKMCCGVHKDDLMIRVSTEEYEKAISHPQARPMDFTGRAMVGFLFISPIGYETDNDLLSWLDKATTYNASLPAKTISRRPRRKVRQAAG